MAGASRTITVRLPEEMFERVEQARGRVPREPWLRDAIESYLTSPRKRVGALTRPSDSKAVRSR